MSERRMVMSVEYDAPESPSMGELADRSVAEEIDALLRGCTEQWDWDHHTESIWHETTEEDESDV